MNILSMLFLLMSPAQSMPQAPQLCLFLWVAQPSLANMPSWVIQALSMEEQKPRDAARLMERELFGVMRQSSRVMEGEDAEAGRLFLEKEVLSTSGSLFVSGDLFAVRLPLLLLASRLQCRAGDYSLALFWLRLARRDFVRRELGANELLLAIRFGKWDEARALMPATPQGLREHIAKGLFACWQENDLKKGLAWLGQAGQMAQSQDEQDLIHTLEEACSSRRK